MALLLRFYVFDLVLHLVEDAVLLLGVENGCLETLDILLTFFKIAFEPLQFLSVTLLNFFHRFQHLTYYFFELGLDVLPVELPDSSLENCFRPALSTLFVAVPRHQVSLVGGATTFSLILSGVCVGVLFTFHLLSVS